MQSRPPLIAVRAFEAAARHLSFSGAADELAVTPAAVSHHIKRLEEALGQRLFDRLNRAVVLTRAGQELFRRVGAILAELDAALLDASQGYSGRLRVTALPSLAVKWLMPRLHGFEARHPDIELEIDASDALANLEAEPVDVALRYGTGIYPGLHVDRLMDGDVIAVCSPQLLTRRGAALATSADLRHYRLLHDSTHARFDAATIPNWRLWMERAGVQDVNVGRGPVFGSIHLALDAAVAGNGVALAPLPLVAADLAAGKLVRVIPDVAMRNPYAFWMVCQASRVEDRDVAAFRAWALGEACAGIPPSQARSPR